MIQRMRLFAILEDRAGRDHVELQLAQSATVADAIVAVAELPVVSALRDGGARMAVNHEYVTPTCACSPGMNWR